MEFGTRRVRVAAIAAGFLAVLAATVVATLVLAGDDAVAQCDGGLALSDPLAISDPAQDVYQSPREEGDTPVDEPSFDLLELRVLERDGGVCVSWTTRKPAPDGTVLAFGATGPYGSDGAASSYGFDVELEDDAGRIGDVSGGDDAPRALEGDVTRSGRTVSVHVPSSELSARGFPYERFSFTAFLTSPPVEAPGLGDIKTQYGDQLPGPGEAELGYDDGRSCPPPCAPLALDERRLSRIETDAFPEQTSTDLTSAANDVCRRAARRLNDLERPRSVRAIRHYAGKAWSTIGGAVSGLRAMQPPTSWESFLIDFEFLWRKMQELHEVVPPESRSIARQYAADVDELARRMRLGARELELGACQTLPVPLLSPPIGGPPPGSGGFPGPDDTPEGPGAGA